MILLLFCLERAVESDPDADDGTSSFYSYIEFVARNLMVLDL